MSSLPLPVPPSGGFSRRQRTGGPAFWNRQNRLLLIGTVLWTIANLSVLIFYRDLDSVLWIFMSGVELALFLAAFLLVVWAMVRIRRFTRMAVGCALVIVGGVVFASTAGRAWGERMRFTLVRHSYERRLQEILRSFERGAPTESRPGEYLVEPGPPVRVAFVWDPGITDNWVGLVYDPSGVVMKAGELKADGSNRDAPALLAVRQLFGGDLFRTVHLEGHWYLCAFT